MSHRRKEGKYLRLMAVRASWDKLLSKGTVVFVMASTTRRGVLNHFVAFLTEAAHNIVVLYNRAMRQMSERKRCMRTLL